MDRARATKARHTLAQWFDAGAAPQATDAASRDRVDWARIVPFVGMHLACLGVIWVGISPVAVGAAVALYLLRMFAITGFYHRYFSHRTFKTSRAAQFAFARARRLGRAARPDLVGGASPPSPRPLRPARRRALAAQRGFLWSHMGWFLSRGHFAPDLGRVRDLLRFPELRWLDRFDILVPAALAVALLALGRFLEHYWPGLGTSGGQMLVWGFFVSTVACYHGTYTINSLCHVWGRRRYDTGDESRNNWLLALVTLGEGWHNNHHHYPMSARQGFYWWEIDITYYLLRALAALGIIWDLKPVPREVRDTHTAVAR